MPESEVGLAGAGYQTTSRDHAESMALVIERWLGNPLVRKTLKFVMTRNRGEEGQRNFEGLCG